ncbi:aminotransferase class V-fold PLP-dependent enzyme [Terrarubrum flagellatum]|uniref:aminotransferase class V-fold PLP-dependent enzyme n=1 Tax=Terrirubrum flagellatum TaxID=2895980 RepID=UPI0031452370
MSVSVVRGALPARIAEGFSIFRAMSGDRLHFAAHSHHWWPDVAREAQLAAWDDAARLVDDKWEHVLGEIWSDVKKRIAAILRLPDENTLVPAPNTHEIINRLLSCFPADRPTKIISTDGEFHSFRRQSDRLVEEGLIELITVPTEPFATFADRLVAATHAEPDVDMVFVSQVLFNSGFALTELEKLVDQLSAPGRFIVIDGYHGFMARPTDLSRIADRAFYIAGGYKYAMAGEGCCFLHAPPGFGARPRNTGWYASFGALSAKQSGVPYAEDGWRFMGATFDPSGLYRMRATLGWLANEDVGPAELHSHAVALQERFLDAVAARRCGPFEEAQLVVPRSEKARGNFLTFAHPDANAWYRRLHELDIVADVRGDRLRVGFGAYHTAEDVDHLIARLEQRWRG